MIPMKRDLFDLMIHEVFIKPRLPKPRELENAIRQILAHDPMRAERAVGSLYGSLFKRAEAKYDGKRAR